MEVDERLKHLISRGENESVLRRAALNYETLRTLQKDALWHLAQGETSLDEVMPYVRQKKGVPSAVSPTGASTQPTHTPKKDGARQRILVTDDDPTIRLILRGILEKQGYDCRSVKESYVQLVGAGFKPAGDTK